MSSDVLPLTLLCSVLLALSVIIVCVSRAPSVIRIVALAALLVQLTFSFANQSQGWLRAPDSTTYHEQALALSQGYDPSMFVAGKEGWPTLLSWLYMVAAPSQYIPLTLNAALCALMVPLTYRVAENAGRGAGLPAVALLCLQPGWWLWGSIGVREPIVWVISLLALWALLRAIVFQQFMAIVAFGVAVVGLAWVRGALALILGVAGAAALLVSRRPTVTRFMALVLLTPLVAVIVLPQLTQIPALRSGSTNAIQTELSASRSGFNVGNPALVALRTGTGPWPWELRSLGPLAIPDMFYIWVVIILSIAGLAALRMRSALFALPSLGILASLAVTSGNYGTMLRLRTQAILWLIPLMAVGWQHLGDKRAQRRPPAVSRRRLVHASSRDWPR